MNDANRCPSCGAERPADSPEGLCPRCLMQQALDSDPPLQGAGPGVELTVSLEPASTGALARIGESVGGLPHVHLRDTEATAAPEPDTEPAAPEAPGPAPPSERYRLFGEIARGGMGAVLRGRDVDLGRDLAVKVMLEAHTGRPEMVRRFVEEAQIGGQLQHPGVVPVYELGAFADRRPFFTMKLVRGRTLAELLRHRADPGADLPRFLAIFQSTCQTMAYAHARGVIHRDLKPSNVMVGSFGEVQVMDWGLAKVLTKGAEAAEAGRDPAEEAAVATARSDDASDRSQAGSILGTPAYMAPEQARGELDRLDERADVFALGSILCEILTGQPAFTGAGSLEILRKASRGELAEAAARLEGCGAERELIALAADCLAAERDNRPRGAAAAADRITAHLAGVQERLRAAELARVQADARAEEERKRRKLSLALAASLVALMAVSGGGAAVYLQQRQAQVGRLEVALREAEMLRDQAWADPEGDPVKWHSARTAAERAVDLLGPLIDGGSRGRATALRREVSTAAESADRDAALLAEVLDIRSAQGDDPDGSASDAAYARAFRNCGVDLDRAGPESPAAEIKSRPPAVAMAVADALDDWAFQRRRARPDDAKAWTRLTVTASRVDPDETRVRLRRLWSEPDIKARREPLRQLVREADPKGWPTTSLRLLAGSLAVAGDVPAAVDLLRRAQAHHPGDVWVNHDLARLLKELHPPRSEEAIRFFSVARALRPALGHELAHELEGRGRTGEAETIFDGLTQLRPQRGENWGCLGHLLRARGERARADVALEKAVAIMREAIRIPPDLSDTHNNLGRALHDLGRQAEAIAEYREAIRLEPNHAKAHGNLGNCMGEQGKLDEAITEYREAIRLQPDFLDFRNSLGNALSDQGKLVEAIAEWRAVIAIDRDNLTAHGNLGNALKLLGEPDEAIAECREAIRIKPDDAKAYNNLGNALSDQGKRDQAIAAYREAIRIDPDFAFAHKNLGIALVGQGKRDEAIAEYREAIRIKPDYGGAYYDLGVTLRAQGNLAEAITAFRAAVRLKPGDVKARAGLGVSLIDQAEFPEAVAEFRKARELAGPDAERQIPGLGATLAATERLAALAPRLPAVVRGDDKPRDPAEGLTFADLAFKAKRYGPAARLFAAAFQAEPKLAEEMRSGNRYNAACAAALAGAGKEEAKQMDEPEKARWRAQAVDWLKADLTHWTGLVRTGPPQARAFVARTLRHWKDDADLAGIRDEEAIKALPEDERKTCRALWADVDAMLKRVQGP